LGRHARAQPLAHIDDGVKEHRDLQPADALEPGPWVIDASQERNRYYDDGKNEPDLPGDYRGADEQPEEILATCSRPGPASTHSASSPSCEELKADGFAATVSAAATTQRGGMAVSRLEGRGFSLDRAGKTGRQLRRPNHPERRCPDPVPRIGRASLAVAGMLASSWVRRCKSRGTFSPQSAAPLAANLTLIAHLAFWRQLVFGWPHRWPPIPAVPAFNCFARPCCEDRTPSREPSPISPVTFVSLALHRHARYRAPH